MPNTPASKSAAAPSARGFTLLEVMLVLTLALLLAALAVPAYQPLLTRWALAREAQTLVEDLRHARSQALARGLIVSICPSVDGLSCGGHADWGHGWIIFVDLNGNRILEAHEQALRQHRVSSAVGAISSNSNSSAAGLSYQANGQARAAGQGLTLKAPSASIGSRLVCISMQGRASLRAPGPTECS